MDDLPTIHDGEDRECHYCGNTIFHRNYGEMITCNNCYTRWDPLRRLHKLFVELEA